MELEGWYYRAPKEYTVLSGVRRKRCCSCKTLIDIGSVAIEFERFQQFGYENIKAKIFGEDYEEQLASWFMCEGCGDLFFSLEELGFCIYLDAESMPQLLKQYQEMRGIYGS